MKKSGILGNLCVDLGTLLVMLSALAFVDTATAGSCSSTCTVGTCAGQPMNDCITGTCAESQWYFDCTNCTCKLVAFQQQCKCAE